MPPSDVDAVRQAAQRHAYAALVRTEGWRLYMVRQLRDLAVCEKTTDSPEYSDHMRSMRLGEARRIREEIAYVYKAADEENPLEAERAALLGRLAGMPYTDIPLPAPPLEQGETPPPPRRSRRAYAGGVE